jgi:hypothetical protein
MKRLGAQLQYQTHSSPPPPNFQWTSGKSEPLCRVTFLSRLQCNEELQTNTFPFETTRPKTGRLFASRTDGQMICVSWRGVLIRSHSARSSDSSKFLVSIGYTHYLYDYCAGSDVTPLARIIFAAVLSHIGCTAFNFGPFFTGFNNIPSTSVREAARLYETVKRAYAFDHHVISTFI